MCRIVRASLHTPKSGLCYRGNFFESVLLSASHFANVTFMLKKIFYIGILLALTTGCCRIPDPSGEAIVESVFDRTGYDVAWDRKAPVCKEELINCLLQDQLTVDEAVQIALLNSPKIQALFEEVGIAQSDLINASLIANPIFGMAVRIPEGSFPSVNPEIDALQSLVSILLQPIRRKSACFELAGTVAHVTSELFQFIELVSETFYNAQASMISLEWQKQILEARELEFLVTEKLIEVGNTNQLHYEIHFDEFQEALLSYESMQIEVNTLKMELGQLMGVFEFEISCDMGLPPSICQQNLIGIAYHQRFDLLASRMQTDAIATSMGLYQWYAYTDFAAGVAYEREIDGTNKTGPGFVLEIPIFNFGQGDRMKVRAMFCQNVQQTRDLCLQIQQEVRTFYEGMVLSKSRSEQLQHNVIPDKQEIVDQNLRFYNFMNASVYDLLEAKVAELMSEMMLVEAKRDYLVYRALLIRSLGGVIP